MPHKLKKCDRIAPAAAWCDGQYIMSDILQFVAHWSLIAVLTFFFIGTVAYLMGLIVVPRKWKVAALVFAGAPGAPHRRRRDTWQRRAVRKSAMISHKCQRTSDLGRLGESGFYEGIRSLERVQDRRRRKNKEAAKPARPAPARGSRASPQSR
jgi:hypothetical protein